MQVLYECCAGLDVHKKTVTGCVRRIGAKGKVHSEVRQFGTMTGDLLQLGVWMQEHGVKQVAMESTGVFWKPVYNVLEGCFTLLLCNPRDIKQVPGRKTDVKDCQWLAQLLQYGLLKGSFVPARPLRELRDLTRQYAQLTQDKTRVANRIHKQLEDANIKLGSVATDVLGVSGRDMIKAIIRGEDDPTKLADLARRRLRSKIPQLKLALEGRITEHHRFMLSFLYRHLQELEGMLAELSEQIDVLVNSERLNDSVQEEGALPFPEAVELLTTIPGIQRRIAEAIVAEIGTEMSRFATAGHLASWTGLSPGNNESAGKRKSGKTTKGNPWVRRVAVQAAWCAVRTKGTYLSAQYRQLAPRRGAKRAIVAVAHSIVKSVYHMLKNHHPYMDLGAEHFDRISPERRKRHYVRRLQALGYTVTLQAEPVAA